MSHLQYFSYPGFGEHMKEKFRHNQAVRIGDRIECSGQGGWSPETGVLAGSLASQIDQAFNNVDLALKTAGGKGWSQVYRVVIYVVDGMNDEGFGAMIRNFKEWMPEHKPLFNLFGVKDLALEGMGVEIEVAAHLADKWLYLSPIESWKSNILPTRGEWETLRKSCNICKPVLIPQNHCIIHTDPNAY
ncbi:Endoribonuclease L-PSP/chorismate mutase-like protein [Coprinopsis sp. MPI-PUGE-AT-0042]|nr:Endoribonuclease L-PSP/chorismate mutase-like protein [Coprinopsis sp. MPI-PUGE-AT-0042]